MNIKFEYHFPNKCGIYGAADTAFLHVGDLLFDKVKSKYPNFNFSKLNTCEFPDLAQGMWQLFIIKIINLDNNKYFLISYYDTIAHLTNKDCWDSNNCKELFAATGVQRGPYDLSECDLEYTPISMFPISKDAHKYIEMYYENDKNILDKPFFRGTIYEIRHKIQLTTNLFDITDERIPPKDYTYELSKNLINIDFPAANMDSFRFYDILGVQSCALACKRVVRSHNKLIPNYHYALVEVDDLYDTQAVIDAYLKKYEYLKKNQDEARWIAKNGREWYLENCPLEKHTDIIMKLINFDKLL